MSYSGRVNFIDIKKKKNDEGGSQKKTAKWGACKVTKGFLSVRRNTASFSVRLGQKEGEGHRQRKQRGGAEEKRGVNCCKLWLLASLQREQYFNGCATCRAWGRLADPRLCHPSPRLTAGLTLQGWRWVNSRCSEQRVCVDSDVCRAGGCVWAEWRCESFGTLQKTRTEQFRLSLGLTGHLQNLDKASSSARLQHACSYVPVSVPGGIILKNARLQHCKINR